MAEAKVGERAISDRSLAPRLLEDEGRVKALGFLQELAAELLDLRQVHVDAGQIAIDRRQRLVYNLAGKREVRLPSSALAPCQIRERHGDAEAHAQDGCGPL